MDLTKLTARVKLDASEYEIGIGKVKASTVAAGHLIADFIKSAANVATGLVKVGLGYNMQMEDYATNFKVMLGSMEAATAKVDELKTMAAKTPFAMEDLADATQTLLAFGVQSEKTTSVMTRLGDISLGNAQRMSSLSNAYGKAAAQGKLTGEVVQMMVDAGFNPLLQISEATGESMEKLQKRMSAGAVSVDELDLALRRATSEGGQFYRGMEEASKTLSGQFSTLEDNWNALLGEAMNPVNEQLSGKILPKTIESLDRLSAALFGVEEDAEAAKKALFFDPEGNPTDPHQNLLTWVDNLMQEWTNGIAEDQSVIDQYVGTFEQNTQSMKDALRARINDMANPMTETEIADAERKIAEINTMEDRVEQLLQKRAGGYITDEELNELNTMIATIGALKTEVETAAGFDENIVTPWERLVTAAGNLTADGIDKVAAFIEDCASDNGKKAKDILEGSAIALGAIEGMKFAGLHGAVAGGVFGLVLTNLEEIEEKAISVYNWIGKVLGLFGYNPVDIDTYRTWKNLDKSNWTDGGISEAQNTGSRASGGGSFGSYVGGRADTGGGIGTMAQATVQKHATGLDYVPFNEYPALLHEGEAVLTRIEAQQWRAGNAPNARKAEIDYERLGEAVARAIANSGIGFSVGGRQLAVATAGDNSRAINARQHDINIGKVRF